MGGEHEGNPEFVLDEPRDRGGIGVMGMDHVRRPRLPCDPVHQAPGEARHLLVHLLLGAIDGGRAREPHELHLVGDALFGHGVIRPMRAVEQTCRHDDPVDAGIL